jgi:hypothetical protein
MVSDNKNSGWLTQNSYLPDQSSKIETVLSPAGVNPNDNYF